jgi:hypothetical protein
MDLANDDVVNNEAPGLQLVGVEELGGIRVNLKIDHAGSLI